MFRKQFGQESGQSMIEYALLAGLLVFAALAGLMMLGASVDGVFDQLDARLNKAMLAAVSLPIGAGQPNEAVAPGKQSSGDKSNADQSNGRGNPNAPGLSIAPGQNGGAGKPETPGQAGAPGQSIAPGGSGSSGKSSNPGRPERLGNS